MTIFVILAALACILLLAGLLRSRLLSFIGQKPEDYEGLGPAFDLPTHLNGPLTCDGVIFGPTGRVTSRFTARMVGIWDGNNGTLEEEFLYDSGSTQTRAWHLLLDGPGRFSASADDIIGQGEGRHVGHGVRLSYRITLPADAGGYTLDVVDWMYLLDNGTIINRSQFRKFGLKVAELVATIRREEMS